MRIVALTIFFLGLATYLWAASQSSGPATNADAWLASEQLSVRVQDSRFEAVEGVPVRVSSSWGEKDFVTNEFGITPETNVPLDERTSIHIFETVTETRVIAGSCWQVDNTTRAAAAELDAMWRRVEARALCLDPVSFSGVFPNTLPDSLTAQGQQHFFLLPPSGNAWEVQAEAGDASTFEGHLGVLATRSDVDSFLAYHGFPTGDFLGGLILRCELGKTDRHGFIATAKLLGSRHSLALPIDVFELHSDDSTFDGSKLDVRSLSARAPRGTEDMTYASVLLQGEFHAGYTVILFKPNEPGLEAPAVREVVSRAPVLLRVAPTRSAK